MPETGAAVDDTLLLTEHQVDVWQEVAGLLVPLLLPPAWSAACPTACRIACLLLLSLKGVELSGSRVQ